jgi:hypothetical protein
MWADFNVLKEKMRIVVVASSFRLNIFLRTFLINKPILRKYFFYIVLGDALTSKPPKKTCNRKLLFSSTEKGELATGFSMSLFLYFAAGWEIS